MSLTKKQTEAARMVAEDRLTHNQIAAKCGIVRRTLARWILEKKFAAEVEAFKNKASEGAKKATEQKAFNTVDRLIELASIEPDKTNGTMTGQVRACMGIAAIRGEIIERHADVTERLKNKSADELDFIAIHRRDPADSGELQKFIDSRKPV
ncbi:MAG TPA: phBC6A51 family helix-turn-helix protein [Candidatus Angelobacter sp.]|nr:phBC6A51 family helix-turn-helix protein [Candidatus Angelobacter sp.]